MLVHTAFLFWGVTFPLQYIELIINGKFRHVFHLATVILAILLPLETGLLQLINGYRRSFNPSVACIGRDNDYIYYTFILPLSIMFAVGSCLLVLIFWNMIKVSMHALNNWSSLSAHRVIIISVGKHWFANSWN